MEREKTVEKIKKSLERKKEKGEPLGRPPFGLKYSEDTSSFLPDGNFHKVLEAISLREEGASLSKVKARTGIPTSTIPRLIERRELYARLNKNGLV